MNIREEAEQLNDTDARKHAVSIVSDFLRQKDDLGNRFQEIGEKLVEMEKMADREIIKKYSPSEKYPSFDGIHTNMGRI